MTLSSCIAYSSVPSSANDFRKFILFLTSKSTLASSSLSLPNFHFVNMIISLVKLSSCQNQLLHQHLHQYLFQHQHLCQHQINPDNYGAVHWPEDHDTIYFLSEDHGVIISSDYLKAEVSYIYYPKAMSPLSTSWRPLLGTIYSIAEHHGTTPTT